MSALGGVCPLVDLHHLTDVAMMNVLQLEAFPHVEGPLIPEVLPLAIQMLSDGLEELCTCRKSIFYSFLAVGKTFILWKCCQN